MHHPTDMIAHITHFVIQALAGARNISVKDRSDDPSHHEQMLHLAPKKITETSYYILCFALMDIPEFDATAALSFN